VARGGTCSANDPECTGTRRRSRAADGRCDTPATTETRAATTTPPTAAFAMSAASRRAVYLLGGLYEPELDWSGWDPAVVGRAAAPWQALNKCLRP
jgi:hypothetical protein